MGLAERLRRAENAIARRVGSHRHHDLERALRGLTDDELDALIACYGEANEWNGGAGLSEAEAGLACDALRKLKLAELRDFRDLGVSPSRFLMSLGPAERATGIGDQYQELSDDELEARIAAARAAVKRSADSAA